MTNLCALPKWPIQDEFHGNMAKNQCDRITSIQNTGLDYFWVIVHQIKQRKKGLGMLIHLHYSKSITTWTYRRLDIRTILDGVERICDTPRETERNNIR